MAPASLAHRPLPVAFATSLASVARIHTSFPGMPSSHPPFSCAFLPRTWLWQAPRSGCTRLELCNLLRDYLAHSMDLRAFSWPPPSTTPILRSIHTRNLYAPRQPVAPYKDLKKSDLETALDDFIAQHSARFSSNPDLAGYFTSRSKALSSPVKKEKETVKEEVEKSLKVAKRRVTKAADEIAAE
ncbi:hypothetical protein NLG97_g7216 [Lecanicillium saksenae]|uniref:Uncharacterized protein n=1 Tax=Lecanicillium saksenae TaxID=468837 RepID=A0ACC1QMK1_9HYPO|nr:hypothetical protein NLG97_g7216 [Lecanicillium saksenae]